MVKRKYLLILAIVWKIQQLWKKKLRKLRQDMGIESYLTGFSGGVRYAPVVRYNKVHVYIAPEDIQEAINYLELKRSG